MRWILKALVMVALAAPIIAWSQTSKPSDAPSTTGTITGTVQDVNGNAAADCIVTAQQNAEKMREGIQGATDAKGKFTLEKVAEGDYNLNVRSRDLKYKAIKSLSVIAGKTTDIGTLKMK